MCDPCKATGGQLEQIYAVLSLVERPEGSGNLPAMAPGLPVNGRLALCDWTQSMSVANQLTTVPGSIMYRPAPGPPKPSSSLDLQDLFDSPAPEPILGESLQSIMDAAKDQLDDLEDELNRSPPKKRKKDKVPYHVKAAVGKLMGSEALCCKSCIYYYPCKDQGLKGFC